MEEEGSVEGSVDPEDLEGEDPEGPQGSGGAEDSEDADGSEDFDDSDVSGWFADPDVEGQERFFDGSEWTTETRSADPDPGVSLHHLPDHAGELQRALAAATDDIDDVEDRLGTLFDRAEQSGERQGRGSKRHRSDAVESSPADEDDETWLIDDEDEDEPAAGSESGSDPGSDPGQNVYAGEPGSIERGVALAAGAGQVDDADDDALAELDEALAHEEPEKVKRKFFRRHT